MFRLLLAVNKLTGMLKVMLGNKEVKIMCGKLREKVPTTRDMPQHVILHFWPVYC